MQFYIDGNQIDADEFFQHHLLDVSTFKSVLQFEDIELHYGNSQVYYQLNERQKIEINIASTLDYHQKFFYKNSTYTQPLFKAIGLKKGQAKPRVLDCSAGMLGDSLLMYSVLESIHCSERNPLVALLITLTLKNHELSDFHFHHADCSELSFTDFDTLYFDPMYEEVNKKTAPKKEMKFFRDAIGEDLDREEKIEKLLSSKKRLVVKRSSKAVSAFKPDISFGKKSTIYDVYLPTS